MDNCIFCKIARGEIPCDKVYEDERVLAFRDIEPHAPVHVLIIPKAHFANIMEADDETCAYLLKIAKKLAKELGVADTGFRLAANTGKNAGQSVEHMHIHLLGGRMLGRPAGD